ncbi:MAG: response regulator transcription factor, partial [Anaerolineales bacterium]|nr:response regulator transcription factor [Anaerolineales bacterium]
MSITVFLADDHTVVRDGLRHLLEAQPDIKVIGDAANGREAVRQVEHLCPQIVVMDIAMPELNGIEATRKIVGRCPDTQVIILSMHSTSEHIRRALKAGAHGYLLKESAGNEVVSAVRAVHANHRYLSQKLSDRLINDYGHRTIESPLARLSPRELEVLQLVVEGKSNAEIVEILCLSP